MEVETGAEWRTLKEPDSDTLLKWVGCVALAFSRVSVARPKHSININTKGFHFAISAAVVILRYGKTIYIFGFDGGADFCWAGAGADDEKEDGEEYLSDAQNCVGLNGCHYAYRDD